MAKGQITRRQKNISRLLREKKEIYPDKLRIRKEKIGLAKYKKTKKTILIIFVCISFFSANSSYADVIRLKNGHTFKGSIIKETENAVVVKIKDGTMTFGRNEVLSIEKESPPSNKADEIVWSSGPSITKKDDLIEYKGRTYTKERFKNLIKQKKLVKFRGEWKTQHEIIGMALANSQGFHKGKLVEYAAPAIASITVDDSGIGSGAIISSNGLIITNWHVIVDSKKIKVKLHDDTGEYSARIVTQKKDCDLALISIGGTDRPYLKLADPDSIKSGNTVLAMGNPFGLSATATTGIISAIRKLKDLPGAKQVDLSRWEEEISLIQTDAAINSGNSGGPLLNLRGQIVGINTFGVPKVIAEGLNFAIHAKILKNELGYYFE